MYKWSKRFQYIISHIYTFDEYIVSIHTYATSIRASIQKYTIPPGNSTETFHSSSLAHTPRSIRRCTHVYTTMCSWTCCQNENIFTSPLTVWVTSAAVQGRHRRRRHPLLYARICKMFVIVRCVVLDEFLPYI